MSIPEYQVVWREPCWSGQKGWYAYVNRVAFVPGHVILAWEGKPFVGLNPRGFDDALNEVWELVERWASKHKEPDCVPVYFRVNLRAGNADPKVAIMPYSQAEIDEAADFMWERIPELKPTKGGGVYHMGQLEDRADRWSVALGKMSDEEVLADLEKNGVLKVAQQMRDLCTEGGGA